ncbi:hypothetical protein [Sphingomonas sp. AX6]|uniref:hypothetical protein n=1 Tax=Sphingomonas sp. AX6 TaxID=2653171 RepID=UPI001F3F60DB|nr:hypothetical protein [Sphingomonas sp. AX6]
MRILLRRYIENAVVGMSAVVFIGLAVVGGCNAAIEAGQGLRPFGAWNDYSLAQIAQVAAPFLVLALCGIQVVRAWIAGVVVTLFFWAWLYLPEAVDPGGGANIGWGILSLFLPIIVFGSCILMLLPEAARRK